MIISLRDMGRACKRHRIHMGVTQREVARSVGYSVENVSAFETGRNDNARLLLWYIANGLTAKELFDKDMQID